MGMKDRSLIDKINPTFIALTATAIHHCLSAWKTGEFRVPPEFGPGGGAQRKCDTRNINHAVNNVCTDVFRRLDADFCSSSPEVQAKKIDNIRSMIRRRIHSTGTDPAMAQPHNDQGSFDEDFLDYVPEELIEQPDNSFNRLSSFVAATEASMRFSAVLPAIASSSQPVPCSDSNSNSNDITNMTSVENTGLVDGSTIVEGAMSLGG
jgi:Domain of unknown function (DUF6532)